MLEKRFGRQRAQEIVDALAGKMTHKPFEFLRRTPPEQVAAFLQEEAPQTIAIVLASLPSSIAAKVLAELPKENQGEVALRIATMSETNPLVVRDLEAALKEKLSAILDQELVGAGGVQSLAEILNQAGRSTERHIIQAMSEADQVLAEEVRQRIFTFDDIVTLSDRDIQILLRDVDQKDLAIALRGVGDAVKDKLLNNLSSRGADMLREDMEVMPPQRKAVVDEAQSKIVRAARVLDDAGTITIRTSGRRRGRGRLALSWPCTRSTTPRWRSPSTWPSRRPTAAARPTTSLARAHAEAEQIRAAAQAGRLRGRPRRGAGRRPARRRRVRAGRARAVGRPSTT